jgi:peptidoglycan/LPS O-acetylase OafA/YrhL
LRVFPALWLVVAGSLVTIVVFLGSGSVSDNALGIIIWTIAQATYIQFWNPDMFREYGVGVVNGSLWTIHVELTFYAVLPVMYRLFKSIKADVLLIAVVVVSFAVNYSVVNWNADNSSEEFFQKVLNISAVPWVGMFALGMLAQFHKEILHRLLAGRFLWVLVVFLGISWLTESTRIFPLLDRGNSMGIINYLTVITLIFSAAYSGRSFSDKILKRNDFSYSIYLAHMPIVNVLVQHQIVGYKGFLILASALLLFSIASWFLVEKRILATRRRALYRR